VALASNPALRKGIFCHGLEDLRLKVGERFRLRRQQLLNLVITTGALIHYFFKLKIGSSIFSPRRSDIL
jgi:hypothetical protein